jgi:RHS repeat-associated protein
MMNRARLLAGFQVLVPVLALSQVTPFPGAGPQRIETRPSLESRAGNSVDTASGAFLVEQKVVEVTGGRELPFVVYHDSRGATAQGELGLGWYHNYSAELRVEANGPAAVYWSRSSYNRFQRNGTSNNYTPLDEAALYDSLVRNTNGSHTLTRHDGSIYEFDSQGRLTRAGNKIRQFINITRDSEGRITQLREPLANRSITVRYDRSRAQARISTLELADGRIVLFEYAGELLDAIRNPARLGSVIGGSFVPKNIPDNNQTGLLHPINVTQAGFAGVVRFSTANISHSRPGDLRVFLIAPSGRRREIPKPLPGGSQGTNLDFTDITVGGFEGENVQGVWQVQVIDSVAGSTGQLNGWRMAISGPAYPTYLSYDNANRINGAGDATLRRLFANIYDSQGRVVAQDDGVDTNALARFVYSQQGNVLVTTYTDRGGAVSTYRHDAGHHLLEYTDPLLQTTRYEYDASGNRTAVTDALNRTTRFSYTDGNLTAIIDPANAITAIEYDSRRNVTRITDALGRSSRFQYNGNNNLTDVFDAFGNRVTRPYNGSGQMVGVIQPDGAMIDFGYTQGMMTMANHPAGGTLRQAYDNTGRLTRMSDAEGKHTDIDYDDRDNIISQKDANGNTTTHNFDLRGRRSRSVSPAGAITRYEYDGNDNLIAMTDPLGNVTRFEYDGQDRRVRTIDPLGNVIAAVEYDALGQVIAETNAAGETTRTEYDAAGNVTATIDHLGIRVEQRVFDIRDNPVEVVNALGNKSTARYDLLGRPFETRNPLNDTLILDYDLRDRVVGARDALGRLLRRTFADDDMLTEQLDAANRGVRFGYDSANRMTSITPGTGGSIRLTYNRRDQPVTITTRAGRRAQFTYDDGGRQTRLTHTATNAAILESGYTVDHEYDAEDRPTRVLRRATATGSVQGTITRTYDAAGRMLSYTDEAGQRTGYSYDAAGNLIRLTYPDGVTVSYTYNAAGRVTSVTDWAQRVTEFTYDRLGRLARVRFPNGAIRTLEYDPAGRVARRTEFTAAGGVIAQYRYSYDLAGRLAVETSSSPGPSSLPGVFTASTNNENWLTNVSIDGAAIPVAHDADGNLTQGPLNGQASPFAWDAAGRLRTTQSTSYAYDAEDRLLRFTRAGQTTTIAWNPAPRLAQVVQTLGPGGRTRYVHGVGLLYSEQNGNILVHHFDERGSAIAFSGGNGGVAGRVTYSPYGRILLREGATNSLFLFHGLFGVITSPDELIWMRSRWYHPELRRFLSEDARFGEITQPDSLNRYAFLGGAPALRVDPDGEFWWVAVGAAVGAVANVAVQVASDVIRGKASDWKTYAAAAAGGAVMGAGLALCPTCGILAGAAGGIASNLVERGLRGQRVNAADLAVDAAFGAAGGGLAGGAGRIGTKVIGKAGSKLGPQFLGKLGAGGKAAARRAIYGRADLLGRSLKQEAGRGLVRGLLKSGFELGAEETGAGEALGNAILNGPTWLQSLWQSGGGRPQPPRPGPIVEEEARAEVNRGSRGVYGEYIMWNAYLEFLTMAGRPHPNVPGNILPSF